MVTTNSEFDLKQTILLDGPFGPQETERLALALSTDVTQLDILREAVSELEHKEQQGELTPAGRVRLGVGLYLTGQYEPAIACLKKGDGGALASYYTAKSYFALGQYADAVKSYDMAQKSGYNIGDCTLGRAEVYRYQNDPANSLAQLDKLSGAVEQTAEYLYQRGATVAQLGVNPSEAVALYERAVQADRTHSGALFGLALESERRGNDEEALELYKKAVSRFPANLGILFNLGLLYEDMELYDQAVVCYQRIVDAHPTNKKARLFLKDAKASSEMHIDEEAQRKRDRINQVLNTPVTDFELTVRSRNCLKTMGIMTLGDLCAHTEQDLLASKNFGEQSLIEIREMLTLKGLRLGQFATEKAEPDYIETESLSPDEQENLLRPVTDLNLSVRARKCMNRLNIGTIGELVRRTEAELLDCKNFGVTSLMEIREKLTEFNLKLRGE
jgi:DNA-directed RNA polymerase subunit alpha